MCEKAGGEPRGRRNRKGWDEGGLLLTINLLAHACGDPRKHSACAPARPIRRGITTGPTACDLELNPSRGNGSADR